MEDSGQLHTMAALPPEKAPGAIGQEAVWAQAGLDTLEKRKISYQCRELNPAVQPSLSLYHLSYRNFHDTKVNGDNFSLISEIMWLLFHTDGTQFKCTVVRWFLI
jgi:hypothetical protein